MTRMQATPVSLILAVSLVLPLGLTGASAVTLDSGFCGDDAAWSLDSNGTLTIRGTGEVTHDLTWDSLDEDIKEISIRSGITRLGDGCFNSLWNATSVSIPNTVTEIGAGAFAYCENLNQLEVPESVISIGAGAFLDCLSLENVTLSYGLECLGQSAFAYCTSLEEIYLPYGLEYVESETFFGCSSLYGVMIPETVVSVESNAFGDCENLEIAIFLGLDTTIQPGAFRNTLVTIYGYAYDGYSMVRDSANSQGLPFSLLPLTPFSDVAAGAWYEEAVSYVYYSGLMNGTSEETFEPQTELTRAMFVTILGRMAGVETNYPTVSAGKFQDVVQDSWYGPYVAWAADCGIVNGISDSQFGTQNKITREQMATIISRYVTKTGIDLLTSETAVSEFRDSAQVSDYAREGLELMRRTGIITGDQNGNFNPKNAATRAEAATMMMRLAQAIGESDDQYEYNTPAESVVPVESTAPVESVPPTESTAPVESVPPVESTAPVESVPPTESNTPEESDAPEEIDLPEESIAPIESVPPTESNTPAESTPPAESDAPEEIDLPEESIAPVESVPPTESDAPEESEQPEEYVTVVLYYYYDNKTSTLTVNKGNALELPELEQEGYQFTGWYLDSECTTPYRGTPVTESMNLFAGWESTSSGTYTVTVCWPDGNDIWSLEGGLVLSTFLTNRTYDGKTFQGYYLDQNYTIEVPETTVVDQDLTIYPKYETLKNNEEDIAAGQLTVGGTVYYLGQAISELGTPDETLASTYGFTWYVYGTENYRSFFAAGVEDGTVVALVSAGVGFNYQGLICGSQRTTISTGSYQVAIKTDINDSSIVHAVKLMRGLYYDEVISSATLAGESKLIFHLTNAFRVYHGLSPLIWSESAATAARLHSEDMATQNYFDHTSLDGRNFAQRLADQGIEYRSAGENIAAGYINGFEAYNGWVNSSGHRSNMLGSGYRYLGVGGGASSSSTYYGYFAQEFYS